MSDVQRQQLYRSRYVPSPTGRWIIDPLQPAPLGLDGALHLYVAPTGDDDLNSGLVPGEPLRTVQRAMDRVSDYCSAAFPTDVVVEIASGTYAEDVVWNPPVAPQRRVILRANRQVMAILRSGTLTAGSAVAATDAAGAFGLAQQFAGKLLRLRTPAGVERTNATIRSHTDTAIAPCQTFTAAPAAGWTYQVLEPSVFIRSFNAHLPWQSLDGFGAYARNRGQALVLMWLGLGPPVSAGALQVSGGEVACVGCEVRGSVRLDGAACNAGQLWGAGQPDLPIENPVANDFDLTYLAGLACYSPFALGNALVVASDSRLYGFPVCKGAGAFIFANDGGSLFLLGGAIHDGGGIDIQARAYAQIDGGFAAALAFLVRNNVGSAFALRSKLFSFLETANQSLGGIALDSIAAGAFVCDQQSKMRVRQVVVTGAVPGVGVQAMNDSQVRVDPGVSFAAGTELLSDDTAGTFAALTPAAPLLGTAVLTGSTIWES